MALLSSSSWFDVDDGVRARPAGREFVEAVGSFRCSADKILYTTRDPKGLPFVSHMSGDLPFAIIEEVRRGSEFVSWCPY